MADQDDLTDERPAVTITTPHVTDELCREAYGASAGFWGKHVVLWEPRRRPPLSEFSIVRADLLAGVKL